MRIAFLGDFMPSGDQAGKPVNVSRKLKKKLDSFDLRVATLETAVGSYVDIDEIKMPKSEVAVWSKPEDLQKLLDLSINVVSLANNHACDCGVNSMLQLLDTLRNLGITPIGGGHNLEEAMKPAVVEKDGESVAIIGCCEDNPDALGTLHFATETESGIYRLDEKVIIPQIQELKRHYNYVAVVVHWGVEHIWLPENYDVVIGQKLIDAGADMIIGGHPHHIQPLVMYKKCPIFYSLGNFYFPDFCLDKVSNVYYPEKEKFDRLPVFDWMAPARRNFAMRYFWKYYGRLGMMAMVSINKDNVKYKKDYSKYKNGKLTISKMGITHSVTLSLFSHYVGKESSKRINNRITWLRNLVEYRILGLFCRKYQFFNYLQKHNY